MTELIHSTVARHLAEKVLRWELKDGRWLENGIAGIPELYFKPCSDLYSHSTVLRAWNNGYNGLLIKTTDAPPYGHWTATAEKRTRERVTTGTGQAMSDNMREAVCLAIFFATGGVL